MAKVRAALTDGPRAYRVPASGLSAGDVAVAVALSAVMVALVTGHLGSEGRHGGVGAGLVGVTMTMPVAWRRPAPVAASLGLFAGATLNVFAIGDMVRCGPALPAVFLVGYALGRRVAVARSGLLWCVPLFGSLALQQRYDPAIRAAGVPMFVVLCLITVVCWGAGRVLRSRAAMLRELELRTEALERQRDDNAAIAVAADRARIADDVNDRLDDGLADIVTRARLAQPLVLEHPEAAQAAFGEIQHTARGTLEQLRRSVGTLLAEELPNHPAPVLTELSRLIEGRHAAGTRLVVEGDPTVLPAGLELSAYRIVERLFDVVARAPGEGVLVAVRFHPDFLEIAVNRPGLEPVGPEIDCALAAARQRAALHGGTLVARRRDASWCAVARLPLAVLLD